MGLDIWFAEDIRNALLAADEASAATAAVITEVNGGMQDDLLISLRAYREGYKAALMTVALAFGVAPQVIALRQAQDKALRQAQDEGEKGQVEPCPYKLGLDKWRNLG